MKGACLCGAIEVIAPDARDIGLCHCAMCRRWGSGPMHAVHCEGKVNFGGEAPARYRSSDWAERGFCARCGTHLFYHLLPNNEYILSAGLFQEENFTLASEIFVDQKPGYYELKDDTQKMTGQQVFEMYS